MMKEILFYFFFFFIYSVLGWLVECLYSTFDQKKLCFNRGFLLGPYCPIYGCCALFMILILNKYINDPLALFIFIMTSTAFFEYLTSFIMEKIFNVRWWDYSNLPFNIEGRICLIVILGFGILGFLLMYVIHPALYNIVTKIDKDILTILSLLLLVIFIIDYILSFTIMIRLRLRFKNLKGDSTSIIDSEVENFLRNNNYYIKRLFNSFSKIKILLPSGDSILNVINNFISIFNIEKKKYKSNLAKNKIEKKIVKLKGSNNSRKSKKINKLNDKIKKLN